MLSGSIMKIDSMQKNSICKICRERNEMVNHIVSKCSKLAQNKYKTWHKWVGKVIH